MPILLTIVLIAALLVIIYFYIKSQNFFAPKKRKSTDFTRPYDANEQKIYEEHTNKQDEISKEDQEKLSWQFLTHIVNKIKSVFSKEDQDLVYKMGKTLDEMGVKYIHDNNQNLNIKSNIKSKSKSKEQNISK